MSWPERGYNIIAFAKGKQAHPGKGKVRLSACARGRNPNRLR